TLNADGEDRPWIYSNAIYAVPSAGLNLPLDAMKIDAEVSATKNIPYVDGAVAKQKLDLYLPKNKTNFPVLIFVHGGGWTTGDKALYQPLGNLLAKAGIGVAIPGYRLMPGVPFASQMDDVASAVAWVMKNLPARGGDLKRVYLSGHSAGGHLVSLLASEPETLQKHGIDPAMIRGVISLSGVYDVKALRVFGDENVRREASPMAHVRSGLPPFLITYCQWDYPFLPFQAREFDAALRKAFVPSRLVYVPGLSHITEMLHTIQPEDITIKSILRFIQTGQP
ncbi:MAG TPA: alpha/beta hydrolase, partial [Bryobacteraceae bacterium]